MHRDIKPANVLLTPDGGVKVTDFGIARAWDDSDQLTRTGAVIGTATYFSPEQAQGLTADGRSDLYALGVVMYELLTGVPPFVGESPVSVAYQHVREFAPPPSDLNPNIPAALDAIVMRCLEKDPRRRYQTAGALAADLSRFLSGQVPAGPAARRGAHPPHGRRRRPPAAPGRRAAGPPSRETAYPEPGRPDRSTLIIGILAAVALLGLGLVPPLPPPAPRRGTAPRSPSPTCAARPAPTPSPPWRTWGSRWATTSPCPTPNWPPAWWPAPSPPPARRSRTASTVQLLISSGAGDATVPSLVGETETRARELLSQAGLGVERHLRALRRHRPWGR